MQSKPLLSICIPTFNRADSLKLLLENISQECPPLLNNVEIVVSDNASTDHTEGVVRDRSDLPIIYNRNTYNLGGARNLLTAAAKVATGDFVWILGDDDMILPGGIDRVIESITKNQDIDYHYINFGWIKATLRDRVIQKKIADLDLSNFSFQCDLKESRKLAKLEDLAFLPGKNPSALFCGIFCFATRRKFFVDALDWVKPTSCTDPSTTNLNDWYPHAMASIIPTIGKPIAYIGIPCMMQSIGGWEWKKYLSKSQIFGVYELFVYLESKGFDKKCMNHLWRSYHKMAGQIFSLMQCYPTEHKGLDAVLKKSIPKAASTKIFWNSFMKATRLNMTIDHEAKIIAEYVKDFFKKKTNSRIGVWGLQGRGYQFIKNNPQFHNNIVWVTDKSKQLHGDTLEYLQLAISPPATISDANLDCLVIGTPKKHINDIIREASGKLSPEAYFISLEGIIQRKS